MKHEKKIVAILSTLFLVTLMLGSTSVFAEEDDDGNQGEATVTWKELPKPVQQSFKELLKGKKGVEFTRDMENGFTTFEAKFEKGGSEVTFEVGGNGALIVREKQIDQKKLPAEVLQAIQHRFPDGKISDVAKVTITMYELDISVGESTYEMSIFGNGMVLNHDSDDDESDDNGEGEDNDNEEDDD